MTDWLDNRVPVPAAALMAIICGLCTCAAPVHAEVRLHASTSTVFTLAFRLNSSRDVDSHRTAQQPEPEELASGLLRSLDVSLQPQLAKLFQFSPPGPFLRSLSTDKARHHEYLCAAALPLNAISWSFPENSLSLVSDEYSTLPQITARQALLTVDYAATALGGNVAAWDITLTLTPDPSGDQNAYATSLSQQLTDSVSPSSTFSSRLVPLASTAGTLTTLPLAATPSADASQAAAELLQPTREGEAVRSWIMPPNVAAQFRNGGARLVTPRQTDKSSQPQIIRAVNSTSSGNRKSGFKR
jgi:hypothetical protein